MFQLKKEPILVHVFVILFCALCIIPFLMVVAVSFSREQDIIKFGYAFFPRHFDLTAYQYVFKNPNQILNSYKVTALSTIIGTALSVLIMTMIAYPLSRPQYKFRNALSFTVFFTMLFSGGLVPSYILISQYLKMSDNFWVLVVPGLVNAWFIIILRTFFQSISASMVESAKLDGANEFKIFFRIILPLSKPAIATVALLGALARWNDWFTAMLYIRNEDLLTLQYLLQRIMLNVEILKSGMLNIPGGLVGKIELPQETVRMAMAVIATGPMLFVFPFFQKYFVKGITVGAVKG